MFGDGYSEVQPFWGGINTFAQGLTNFATIAAAPQKIMQAAKSINKPFSSGPSAVDEVLSQDDSQLLAAAKAQRAQAAFAQSGGGSNITLLLIIGVALVGGIYIYKTMSKKEAKVQASAG